MPNRITGSVIITADTIELLNKEGAVASGIGISGAANFEIEPVMGDGQFHGYKETPVMAQLEVTITDRDDRMLDDIAKIGTEDKTVSVIFRTRSGTLGGAGKAYSMMNPVCTRNFSVTAGEGETPIKFVGEYWTESLNATPTVTETTETTT